MFSPDHRGAALEARKKLAQRVSAGIDLSMQQKAREVLHILSRSSAQMG
jgi:hypothetical protein